MDMNQKVMALFSFATMLFVIAAWDPATANISDTLWNVSAGTRPIRNTADNFRAESKPLLIADAPLSRARLFFKRGEAETQPFFAYIGLYISANQKHDYFSSSGLSTIPTTQAELHSQQEGLAFKQMGSSRALLSAATVRF